MSDYPQPGPWLLHVESIMLEHHNNVLSRVEALLQKPKQTEQESEDE